MESGILNFEDLLHISADRTLCVHFSCDCTKSTRLHKNKTAPSSRRKTARTPAERSRLRFDGLVGLVGEPAQACPLQPSGQVDHAQLVDLHRSRDSIDEADEGLHSDTAEHLRRGLAGSHHFIERLEAVEPPQRARLNPEHRQLFASCGQGVFQRLALDHITREVPCFQTTQGLDGGEESALEFFLNGCDRLLFFQRLDDDFDIVLVNTDRIFVGEPERFS